MNVKNGLCKICGNKTRTSKVKTCSKDCLRRFFELRRQSPEWQNRKSIKKIFCAQCDKEFITSKSSTTAKFCSRECLSKWKSINYKGRKLTDDWLKNQSHAKRRENIVRHGDYECEVCKKKFETNLSLRSHKSYCSAVSEQTNVNCMICNKVFKRQRNYEVHVRLKHDQIRNESHRKSVSEACSNRIQQKTLKEELNFLCKLQEFYGKENVVHKFKIEGVNHEYDFYVPSHNLIVEYDGDYWHGNPKNHSLPLQ